MKTLNIFNKQIEEWRRKYQHLLAKISLNLIKPPKTASSLTLLPKSTNNTQSNRTPSTKKKHRRDSVLILIATIVSLTSVVGYRFYNQPQLDVGKIAVERIAAPKDGKFEDYSTTEQRRREVRQGIVPILKQNQETTLQIQNRLSTYLNEIGRLRSLAQPLPFVSERFLTRSSQQYIRSCKNAEFKTLLDLIRSDPPPLRSTFEVDRQKNETKPFNLKLKRAFQELKTYRQQVNQSEFENLLSNISLIRYRYSQAYKEILEKKLDRLPEKQIGTILEIDAPTWQKTKTSITVAAKKILTQGIPTGLPLELMQRTVATQLEFSVPSNTERFATSLLLEILHPNLESDREATRSMAEKAATEIQPAIVKIKQGEIIVERGETITQEDFVLLDGFGLSRRGISWWELSRSGLLVTGAVGIFWLVERKTHTHIRRRDRILICLLGVSAPALSILHIPYTDLPAIGLLISSFYNPTLAVTYVSLITGLVTFSIDHIAWEYLMAGAAGGLLAASIAGKLRSREAVAKLGMGVGLTQGGIFLIINLLVSSSAGTISYGLVPDAISYGLSGVAWIVIASGISPYLERIFDLITPIRLAELSNPNLPLLKRLATETPGTFQHTMFVSTLAEAAARELHCNVELVRAGTLYHDIGKMHDPLAFIENQMGVPNIHDEIDDPYLSAEIIKKHVSEGIVMARKYGLPKAIRDFIPEHQGTLSIAYFYHKAKQKAEKEGGSPVLDADFRYAGPIPQTRETAIMMLADGCEAALRSLSGVTPAQALTTIKKIFKARWEDRQLEDSGLRYEELPLIAEIFVQVWQQCNHRRIAYPRGAFEPKKQP